MTADLRTRARGLCVTAPDNAALPWPLAALDVEASSLDDGSYPIEVGVAVWRAPETPILGWSTLIRPTADWTRRGHWSRKAAAVHGIRGEDLRDHGRPPKEVATTLDAMLAPGAVAWCDGGDYDRYWIDRLFAATETAPRFRLGDWHRLTLRLGVEARERALAFREAAPARHRARPDVELLLLALAHAVGADPGPPGDWQPATPPGGGP